jgi:hypothetical protein
MPFLKAVCWSFCGDETISNQVDLELFLHQLCGSTDVFIKSLSNLSILLSSASPKTVEMGIDFLATILETSTSKQMFPSFRLLHADNEVFRLQDFLQVKSSTYPVQVCADFSDETNLNQEKDQPGLCTFFVFNVSIAAMFFCKG